MVNPLSCVWNIVVLVDVALTKRTVTMSVKQKLLVAVLIALVGAGFALQANATTISGALSATTNMGELFPLVHAIDQSGLSSGYTSGVTDFDTYLAVDPTHSSAPGTDWVSLATTGHADFDLGTTFVVDRVAIWNFGSAIANPSFAIQTIDLLASLDVSFTSPVSLGTFTLTNPNGSDAHAQVLAFASTNAHFFRMEVLSTYGSDAALGEIAFSASTAVPEPASILLFGVGLLSLVVCRYAKR